MRRCIQVGVTSECERTRRRLSGFLEGDLRRPARRRTARHLVRCPDCGRLLESLARAVDALRSLACSGPSARESVAPLVAERIRQERMGS
ncbi:MAG TPA: zf-HC2 domain-containing protein [Gaiellaceae bacterium]|nr:zf-HC2 domain-containing protein [Gaiellaceae bacterium]